MDPELLALLERLHDEENPLADPELRQLRDSVVEIVADIDRSNLSDDDLAVIREASETVEAIDGVVANRRAEAAATAEQLVASGGTRLPRISSLARRVPSSHRPVPSATGDFVHSARVLTAAGQPVEPDHFRPMIIQGIEQAKRKGHPAAPTKEYLGRLQIAFPPERTLDMTVDDTAKLDAVTSLEALTAAGGTCGPVDSDFSIQGWSTAERPVRDSLARFGAARGGLRYVRPATLASVNSEGGQSVWTEATDSSPGASVKATAVYDCPSVQEDLVDAIVSRSQFGNFLVKFSPEYVDHILDVARADHARLAESTILRAISVHTLTQNASVNGEVLGALSDWFATLSRVAAAIRYRNRLPRTAPLRLIYPALLDDLLAADVAREMPGATVAERISITEQALNAGYLARNINATRTLDSPTGLSPLQGFVAQGNGPLVPWPDSVFAYVFPEGSWAHLDAGTLDFGLYRDSTLNNQNNAEFFMETFEAVAFRGVESIELSIDLCAGGARAALEDGMPAYCLSGS